MTINTQKLRQAAHALDESKSSLIAFRLMRKAADALDAQAAQLAAYPADWRVDSSLETWFPLTAEQLKAQTAEIARLREILGSIRQYGNDTLSGRADGGPDDRKWQREAVIEMRNRASAALSGESNG